MQTTIKILTVIVGLTAINCDALADWSDDAAANIALADALGADTQAKIVANPAGGYYVSWFSATGFDVRLQRVDASGNEMWAHNGILIADRGFSSTQDYDLAVDAGGNALLAFRDDRFGGTLVTAQKVAADGTTPWGANGVQFDDGVAFIGAPKITAASDGAVFVGWSHDSQTRLEKLSAGGDVVWDEPTILPNPENTQVMSDLNAADNGSVIVSSVSYASFLAAKHLYAQKVDTDGNAVWDDWTTIFNNESLQFGNFPTFIADGSGGGVFSWYSTTSGLRCWAQHLLADGTVAFPANGAAVSTGSNDRVTPDVAYDQASGETFVFWIEQNASQYAVYGQKFNASGVRQWGAGGLVIAAFTNNFISTVKTVIGAAGVYVLWDEELANNNDRIQATLRAKSNGSAVWNPGIVMAASTSSGKSRLVVAPEAGGGAVMTWTDTRNSNDDVYAQNVNGDGTLGVVGIDWDIDNDGVVGLSELLAVIANWGVCDCQADFDGDGIVGLSDLLGVIANWG